MFKKRDGDVATCVEIKGRNAHGVFATCKALHHGQFLGLKPTLRTDPELLQTSYESSHNLRLTGPVFHGLMRSSSCLTI